MTMELGRRERVADVRTVWGKEADFSDWLVTADGIALLAQDLGVEIEEPSRESRPGDFPCDIVANLLGDESHVVVIENQFGETNHDHLGKFLTYASVHKAMTGIWIAEQAADDHRQVIDWLNENTPATVNLYLAELRVFRIGQSPAAPQLDMVCRPNVSQKIARSAESAANKERYGWRLAFWEDIHKSVSARKQPFRLQKAGASHWSTVSIGRSGFSLSMLLTPRNQSIGVELYVNPVGWKDAAFEQLRADKEAIEEQIGCPLEWMPLIGKKSARILLEAKIDPRRDTERKAVCEWFADKLPLMYATFKDRVAALQASTD
jgi:hypothetical protein